MLIPNLIFRASSTSLGPSGSRAQGGNSNVTEPSLPTQVSRQRPAKPLLAGFPSAPLGSAPTPTVPYRIGRRWCHQRSKWSLVAGSLPAQPHQTAHFTRPRLLAYQASTTNCNGTSLCGHQPRNSVGGPSARSTLTLWQMIQNSSKWNFHYRLMATHEQ